MDYIFAFAGIPKRVFPEVLKYVTYIAPWKCKFILRPQLNKTYSLEDTKHYLRNFAQLLGKDSENQLHQTGFALIYIDNNDNETQNFAAAFAPHILTVGIAWHANMETTAARVAGSKNELVETLRLNSKNVKTTLDLLKREVGQKANKTPLLLPLKNFTSDVLSKNIFQLHENIVNEPDKQALINRTVRDIQRAHPLTATGGRKSCFVDNRKISFHAPGRDLHGYIRSDGNHPDICMISANVRLGAKYPKAFHFDCSKDNQQLTGQFYGCHELECSAAKGDPHLNISPNDHVRA